MSTTQHIRQSQTLKETVRFWPTVCIIQSFTLREYIIIHAVRWCFGVSAGVVRLQFKVIVRFIIVHRLRLVVMLIAASQTTLTVATRLSFLEL